MDGAARALKCFQVELYPTQVSKRIVWSVVRSTSDGDAVTAVAVVLTSTHCSCHKDNVRSSHLQVGCEWAASGGSSAYHCG